MTVDGLLLCSKVGICCVAMRAMLINFPSGWGRRLKGLISMPVIIIVIILLKVTCTSASSRCCDSMNAATMNFTILGEVDRCLSFSVTSGCNIFLSVHFAIIGIGLEFLAVWHHGWPGVHMGLPAFLECIPRFTSCEALSKLASTSEAICGGGIDVFTPLTVDQRDEGLCRPGVACSFDSSESQSVGVLTV